MAPEIVLDASISQTNARQFQEADALVLIDLLRQTEIVEEIETVFEHLLMDRWKGADIIEILSTNGQIILQRCSDLAASTWHLLGSSPVARENMLDRMRRTCRFIEWFYYQLPAQERKNLDNWPKNSIAIALRNHAQAELDQLPKPPRTFFISTFLEDMVLADSVIAKLNHVSLDENQVCNLCFVPEMRTQNDIRVILRRIEHPEDPLEKRIHSARYGEALIAACVISDADCLLNYTRDWDPKKCEELVAASSEEYLYTLPPIFHILRHSYRYLIPILEHWINSLEDSNPRKLWFLRLLGYARDEYKHEPDRSTNQ